MRIDDEVARIMKEAHDRAYAILSSHQMDLMASVLLRARDRGGRGVRGAARQQVGRVPGARGRSPRGNARKAFGGRGEGDGASARRAQRVARRAVDPDAGGRWPTRIGERAGRAGRPGSERPLPHARRARRSRRYATQAEVNAEIDREDDMDSSADAPDPDKKARGLLRGLTRSAIANIPEWP